MDTVSKLQELSLRLDKLEATGEWLEQTLAETDAAAAKSGALISALADDVRQRLLDLVTELETQIVLGRPLTH